MLGILYAALGAFTFALNNVTMRRGVVTGSVLQGMALTVPIGGLSFLVMTIAFGELGQLVMFPTAAFIWLLCQGVVHFVAGRWGIVFDRISEGSFAERMREDPSAIPECLQALARLHRRIHTHPAHQLGRLKSRLATNIARAPLLDEQQKQILLGRLADMPEGDRLCHDDFHPINVLGQPSQPMVIDWPDACCGDPAADVCRSYLLLKLHAEDIAEPYLDAYCGTSNMPRTRILDWLAYVAAARLAEDVPDDFERLIEIVRA